MIILTRTNEDMTTIPKVKTEGNRLTISAVLFVLGLSAVLISSAYAQPSLPNEEVVRIPVMVQTLFGTKQLTLEGTTYRPDGDGPFPLAVLNHGSPQNAAERRNRPSERYPQQSAWFLARGFAVVIPMRRGYAGSEGDWAEGGGPCERSNWYLAGRESAKDIRAAVEFMQARPFVDRSRILLVGQSAGGFGALALAAEGIEGLKGVVNFAGGRRSPQPGKNCSPESVTYSMGQFGRTTKVPTLWIYTENDSVFSVPMIEEMHAAFRKSGGDADLVLLPPFGTDGHLLFLRGMKLWSPLVERFLGRLGLLGSTK
jgi:dienelactone hydrolase